MSAECTLKGEVGHGSITGFGAAYTAPRRLDLAAPRDAPGDTALIRFNPLCLAPLVILSLLAALLPGCATLPAKEGEAPPMLERARFLPDPGPASGRPLPAAFGALRSENPERWLRALVDLRRQVDLGDLIESQLARELARSEARAEALELLSETSRESLAELEPLLDRLFDEGQVDFYKPLRFRARVFVSARMEALEALRGHPSVAELIPEYDSVREARREAGQAASPGAGSIPPGDSWGVELLGLRELWAEGHDGRGTLIGSLDSGVIGRHQAFEGAENEGPFWYDPVRGVPDPVDTVPHGSQVLACACAREVEGRALGSAPGARWAAALSNQFNSYNNVNMSLAADWMIFDVGPDVVLGAWGHGKTSCTPTWDRDMIEAFRATGSVPVFAAGNDGPDPSSLQSPASLPGYAPEGGGPLVVAAIDSSLEVIDASSRGPSPCAGARPLPDVAAPGWEVIVPTAGTPRSLTTTSGTSMSVGWVGGTAALILQVAPELHVHEVEEIIRATASDIGPEGHDPDSGYGVISPRAAVEAAKRTLESP